MDTIECTMDTIFHDTLCVYCETYCVHCGKNMQPWWDCMYPYLEPCGPILKLTPSAKTTLAEATVAQDMAFWKKTIGQLEQQPGFAENPVARLAFAKLRVAIAGLYDYHKMYEHAGTAYQQALHLAPYSIETALRYSEMLEKQEKGAAAIDVLRRCATHETQAWQPYGTDELKKRIEDLSAKQPVE